jgi:hypothetical protein
MTSKSRGSGSKRRLGKSKALPKPDIADAGKTIAPTQIPDNSASDEAARREWRAPAPGIPMSSERYERLKEKAKTVRTPSSKHRQEDPSIKKEK